MVIRKWVLEQIRLVLVSQERSVSGENQETPKDEARGENLMGQGRLSVPQEA
ncbi:MAG: hypothetical protein ACK6AD_08950 [Cyanobacteriota bacterium]|jgi:hypothetical protein